MIVLDFKHGPNAGQRIALDKAAIRVGGPGCDVVIVDPAVANPHCQIFEVDGKLGIIDLGSATGTRVGSAEAPPLAAQQTFALPPGTVVWVGAVAFAVHGEASPARAVTSPKAARPETAWERASGPAATPTTAPRSQILSDSAPTAYGQSPFAGRGTPSVPAAAPAAADPAAPSGPTAAARPAPAGVAPSFTHVVRPRDRNASVFAVDCVVVEPLPDDEDPAEAYAEYEMRASLDFVSGPHAGRRVFFGAMPASFGRAEENQVVLLDPLVAMRHCEVLPTEDDGYAVRPLTKNALLRVNSERVIEPRVLDNGDVVSIGSSDARYVAPGLDYDNMEPAQASATIAVQDAIFAFQGNSKRQNQIRIGRNPDCDLYLYHHRVEREHAEIYFQFPDFYLKDTSDEGTLVNGERVSEHRLQNGDVASLGGFRLKFDIQPLRCSIDLSPPDDVDEIPSFSADVESAALQTMYRVPAEGAGSRAHRALPVIDNDPAKKEEEARDRKSVLWVEPHDVKRNWRVPIMVTMAVGLTTLITIALAQEGGNSFLRRPVSEPHRSEEFMAQVTEHFPGHDACTSCHGAFQGPVADACLSCHPKDAHPLRPAHREVVLLGTTGSCTRCHFEHPRETAGAQLVDGKRCATAGCHADRHRAFFPPDPGPTQQRSESPEAIARRAAFGVDLKADLAYDRDTRKTAIHAKHEAVEGKCGACHSSGGMERPEGQAWRACFGCHGPASAEQALGPKNTECADCHREHGEDKAWAVARTEAGSFPPSRAHHVMFVALLAPALLFGFHNLITSRHKRRVKSEAKQEAERPAMLCDGVELGKALRLPRLTPSKCTGSALCVEACPYGVLEMQPGKPPRPVVARPELCHECGTCVEVCGPGALTMMVPGEPFPLVDRPSVDANYETSVDGSDGGVYVIGEAAAKPGVKNAINLGYWTVQHIQHVGIRPGAAQAAGVHYEVVIIGGGPAGISAAMSAQQLGLRYVVIEKSDAFARTIRTYPLGKILQVNPPAPEDPANPEPGDVLKHGPLWLERDATREEVIQLWEQQAQTLSAQFNLSVDRVKWVDDHFVVRTNRGEVTTLKVILAPGTRGDPRKLGCPGEDLEKVRFRLINPRDHEGQRVAVVGGGNSALEAAIALASKNERCEVRLIYRKKVFSRATPKNRTELERLAAAGKLTLHLECDVKEVRPQSLVLDQGEVANDVVFCMLGAHAPTAWLQKLGVEMTKKSSDWEPGPSDQPAFLHFDDLDLEAPRA